MVLLQKFYYNGHTVTNNNLMEFYNVTVWGDLTNEATGILSLGWEPFFPTDNLLINGSLDNNGKIPIDFNINGTNDEWDEFQGVTTANLDGEIEIRFRNGFVPNLNVDYTIIHATSVVGTFATEVWPATVTGEIIYEADKVHVRFLTILPVELVTFDALLKNQNTLLTWTTASEENNAGFEIQRSSDGTDWKTIDFVDGKGTSDLTNEYSCEDRQPLPGNNYYRLKQIDFDGNYEYSHIEQVTFHEKPNDLLKVFPNPATDVFSIMIFNPNKERVLVKLFSSTGQEIWQRKFKVGEMGDFWEKEFDLPQEEMYFVMIQIGEVVETEKVVVIDKR